MSINAKSSHKTHTYTLTSSNGHPAERKTAWDCKISNLRSLSLISVNVDGLVRNITMRNVTTDVNSPRISPTDTNGLSEIFSYFFLDENWK